MPEIALIGSIVALFLTTVMLKGLVEVAANVEQLRILVGFTDSASPIDLRSLRGKQPSDVGLPAQFDRLPAAALLILLMKCGTCQTLAQAIGRKGFPEDVIVILQTTTSHAGSEWLEANGISYPHRNAILDPEGRICEAMGVNTSPMSITIMNGFFDTGRSVPSVKYLQHLVPDIHSLKG